MFQPDTFIRLLILCDDSFNTDQIQNELNKADLSFDISVAKKQSEFIKKALKIKPEVVIATHQLNNYHALEAFEDLVKVQPYTAFILIGEKFTSEEMRRYMLSGIDSFIHLHDYAFLAISIVQGINKKQTQKALHESQQLMIESMSHLRAVFNNDQNAIFIIGFKFEIIDLNPSAVGIFEKQNAEAWKGKNLSAYIDKDDLKKIRTAHAFAFRGKKSTDEYTFSLPKKKNKQASINFVPLKNEEGQINSVMLICKDVTETFFLKQQFKLSEERFLSLANHAPVGIYYNNADGRCLFVNKKWCEYTGLTFRQSLGHGWTKALHPDDKDRLMKRVSESKKSNSEFEGDYRVVHTSGKIVWVSGRTAPFMDEKGKLLGYTGTVTDITKDKLHEKEISEAHRRQQLTIRLAGLGELERDLKNDKGKWSDEVYKIIELDREEKVPGMEESMNKYIHPEDRERIQTTFRNLSPEGKSYSDNFRIITPSGKVKYLKSIYTFEKDMDGKPEKLFSVIQDLTEVHEYEETLKASEEKFRNLFNNSPDGIYIEDFDGKILEVNEQACLIQGMNKEELIGKNILELAPLELRKDISENFKKMAQGEISGVKSFSWNRNGIKIPIQIKQSRIEFNMQPALLLHVRKVEE